MRFMIVVKANKDSEAGKMPSTELLAEMGAYNQELVNAGIMLAGEGLLTSARGARVRFSGKDRTVTTGPFVNTEELVSGYWIWKTNSIDEAIEWLKRAPFTNGEEVEIRKIAEAEDFGESFTPELQEQETQLSNRMAAQRDK